MKNLPCCGGIFDLDEKIERIQALTTKQEDPATWSDRVLSQKIGKEKKNARNDSFPSRISQQALKR